MRKRIVATSGAVAAVLVALFLPLFVGSIYSISTISGRPSNYQGLNLTWYGAYVRTINEEGGYGIVRLDKMYLDGATKYFKVGDTWHRSSVSMFSRTDFNLDVDEATTGMANLRGSVDQPYPCRDYSKQGIAGLYEVYSWDFETKEGEKLHYEMQEWIFETNLDLVVSPTSPDERTSWYLDTDLWLKAEPFMPTGKQPQGGV